MTDPTLQAEMDALMARIYILERELDAQIAAYAETRKQLAKFERRAENPCLSKCGWISVPSKCAKCGNAPPEPPNQLCAKCQVESVFDVINDPDIQISDLEMQLSETQEQLAQARQAARDAGEIVGIGETPNLSAWICGIGDRASEIQQQLAETRQIAVELAEALESIPLGIVGWPQDVSKRTLAMREQALARARAAGLIPEKDRV